MAFVQFLMRSTTVATASLLVASCGWNPFNKPPGATNSAMVQGAGKHVPVQKAGYKVTSVSDGQGTSGYTLRTGEGIATGASDSNWGGIVIDSQAGWPSDASAKWLWNSSSTVNAGSEFTATRTIDYPADVFNFNATVVSTFVDSGTINVNGQDVATSYFRDLAAGHQAAPVNITAFMHPGTNVLTLKARKEFCDCGAEHNNVGGILATVGATWLTAGSFSLSADDISTPNGDGINETNHLVVLAAPTFGHWTLSVDDDPTPILEGTGSRTLDWDGKVGGALLPSGTHNLYLRTDATPVTSRRVQVKLDTGFSLFPSLEEFSPDGDGLADFNDLAINVPPGSRGWTVVAQGSSQHGLVTSGDGLVYSPYHWNGQIAPDGGGAPVNLSPGTYTLVLSANGQSTTAQVKIKAPPLTLTPQANIFSPDGDGVNDFNDLTIRGIPEGVTWSVSYDDHNGTTGTVDSGIGQPLTPIRWTGLISVPGFASKVLANNGPCTLTLTVQGQTVAADVTVEAKLGITATEKAFSPNADNVKDFTTLNVTGPGNWQVWLDNKKFHSGSGNVTFNWHGSKDFQLFPPTDETTFIGDGKHTFHVTSGQRPTEADPSYSVVVERNVPKLAVSIDQKAVGQDNYIGNVDSIIPGFNFEIRKAVAGIKRENVNLSFSTRRDGVQLAIAPDAISLSNVGENYTYTYNTPFTDATILYPGQNTINVEIADDAGNKISKSITFNVGGKELFSGVPPSDGAYKLLSAPVAPSEYPLPAEAQALVSQGYRLTKANPAIFLRGYYDPVTPPPGYWIYILSPPVVAGAAGVATFVYFDDIYASVDSFVHRPFESIYTDTLGRIRLPVNRLNHVNGHHPEVSLNVIVDAVVAIKDETRKRDDFEVWESTEPTGPNQTKELLIVYKYLNNVYQIVIHNNGTEANPILELETAFGSAFYSSIGWPTLPYQWSYVVKKVAAFQKKQNLVWLLDPSQPNPWQISNSKPTFRIYRIGEIPDDGVKPYFIDHNPTTPRDQRGVPIPSRMIPDIANILGGMTP